jgi:indolepyruvate ferredoxin oxidoreductase beta subunit
LNLIITGVGGQGNVLASQILGQMFVHKGYLITIGETYGASQRGGSVMSHIRVSKQDNYAPLIPNGQCDFVVGLEPMEALRVLDHYGNPEIMMLVNTRPILSMNVMSGEAQYPDMDVILNEINNLCRNMWTLNATEMALEMGNPIFTNIIMIGALSALNLLPFDRKTFKELIIDILPDYHLETNLKAFDKGRSAIQNTTS